MSARIRYLVEGISMQLGHTGLTILLKKQLKFDVQKLEIGDLVMCLNAKGDKLKVIGSQGLVIGYLRMPDGQRIMKDALQYIPATFGAKGFDYDAACKTALERRFGLSSKKVGPLQEFRRMKEAGLA